MVGRAMVTTVASSIAIPEPSTVASSTHRPLAWPRATAPSDARGGLVRTGYSLPSRDADIRGTLPEVAPASTDSASGTAPGAARAPVGDSTPTAAAVAAARPKEGDVRGHCRILIVRYHVAGSRPSGQGRRWGRVIV